jgi:hypothetical protein
VKFLKLNNARIEEMNERYRVLKEVVMVRIDNNSIYVKGKGKD